MSLIGLLIIALASAIIAYIALQPDHFSVVRSTMINAPAHAVFTQINDFNNWNAWSPWAKIDPNAKVTYDGSPLGYGAIMAWSGDKQVGAGKMTISESRQDERIRIKLDLLKPAKATHDVQFDLKPIGEDQTEVTWAVSGEREFIPKAMNILMKIDDMIGAQYEQGLANLKAVVEGQKKIGAS